MPSTVQPVPALLQAASVEPSGPIMIAVTTRPAVRERLKCVCKDLSFAPPWLVDRVEQALRFAGRPAVLLLDLASCCRDPQLSVVLRTWETTRPESPVVLFASLLDRESELRVAVRLSRELRRGELRLLTASDFCDTNVWRELGSWSECATLIEELRADLLAAVAATGRSLRARSAVLDVLRGEIGGRSSLSPASRAPQGPARETTRLAADRQRKAHWRSLHRGGQLPPSQLRALFRVLWYTRLRELGWPTDRIAQGLGFRTARDLRRALRRHLGVGLRQLAPTSYARALAWVAGQLTGRSVGHLSPISSMK